MHKSLTSMYNYVFICTIYNELIKLQLANYHLAFTMNKSKLQNDIRTINIIDVISFLEFVFFI